MALVRPFETFFEDCAGPAGYHGAHHEAFVVASRKKGGVSEGWRREGKGGVVQVGHDDLETGVFGTENVSFGDFDVVEFYVGCSGCCGVGGFDEFGFDVGVSFDEEDGVAFVGFAGCDEVVAEDAVGDPL